MRGGDRSIGFRSDHNLDHLRLRTTWKLWVLQHVKARVSDEKARKSTKKHEKARKKRQKTDVVRFGSKMLQVRVLSLRYEQTV